MGVTLFLEKISMRFYTLVYFKIYLYMLFWFIFYYFIPPMLLSSVFLFDKKAFFYSLLSILLFTLGYLLHFLKYKRKNMPLKSIMKTYQLLYLYIFALGLYLLFGTFFAISYSIVAGIYTVKLLDNKKFLIAIIVASITFSLLISEFTRMYILMYILYIFLTYYLRSKQLHVMKIISIVLLSVTLLISMLYIRSNQAVKPSVIISTIQNNPKVFLKMIDAYYVYNIYTKVLEDFPKNHDYLYGASLIKPFVFWIPRSIWKNKPESLPVYIGRYYYGQTRGKDYSTGMTITGEFYINDGLYGIIVFSFLFGLISSFFAKQYLKARTEYGRNISMIYFLIFPSLIRGGIAATIIMFILLIIFLFLVFKLKQYLKKITLVSS